MPRQVHRAEDNQLISVSPGVPLAGFLRQYAGKFAGRGFPTSIAFSPDDIPIPMPSQPAIFRSSIGLVEAIGNGTANSSYGNFVLAAQGTATAAVVALTTRQTMMKRTEYLVTTPSTSAIAGFRENNNKYFIGASGTQGGFYFVTRWGPATGVATATNRSFIGMTTATANATDVQPSSLLNMMGIGWDAADTNMQFMKNDGSGTATKVDLGASFPVPTVDRTKAYDVTIFCPPHGPQVFYELRDLDTEAVVSGASGSTDLPAVTTLLSPRGWISVGGTSSVIGFALAKLYIDALF
jgi:hypothetical protein